MKSPFSRWAGAPVYTCRGTIIKHAFARCLPSKLILFLHHFTDLSSEPGFLGLQSWDKGTRSSLFKWGNWFWSHCCGFRAVAKRTPQWVLARHGSNSMKTSWLSRDTKPVHSVSCRPYSATNTIILTHTPPSAFIRSRLHTRMQAHRNPHTEPCTVCFPLIIQALVSRLFT